MSAFHETFGYYAHGVDETTAMLPAGWEARLFALANENTGGATGWCLDVHDLAVSKLVAAREKDVAFVRVLLEEGMVDLALLRERAGSLPAGDDLRERALERLRRIEGAVHVRRL